MFENKRNELGYTIQGLKKLLSVFGKGTTGLPMFPNSDNFELRKSIYSVLCDFPRIKNSIHDTAFQYAKSLKTESGIKTKFHYEDDPDGIKKQEIYRLLVDLKKKYYDAIRHTENLISCTERSSRKIEHLLTLSEQASTVFEKAFSDLTAKWQTGAYGKNVIVPQKRKRKTGGLTQKEALAILIKHDFGIKTTRTIRNWEKGTIPAPKDYPGRDDAIVFEQWASTSNYRMRSKIITVNMAEEEISRKMKRK